MNNGLRHAAQPTFLIVFVLMLYFALDYGIILFGYSFIILYVESISMDKIGIAEKTIAENGGIAKTSDLLSAGLSKFDIGRLTDSGAIVRIRHGFYRLRSGKHLPESLSIAVMLPDGIVAVESALFLYGYSDFTPREWSLAVPRSISLGKLKIDVPIKAYFIQREVYELGKTAMLVDGIEMNVYDRERTVCDCFKYRSRLDSELFAKAVKAYAADENKNLGQLARYAKALGVYKKVKETMEVLLNG